MAQKTAKKRRKDHAKASFLLLMLSVVLVFGFGLILGKQEQAIQQTAAVPRTSAEEIPTETIIEETVPPETVPPETVPETLPEFHPATDFWSAEPHIYLRANHQKQVAIGTKPGFTLANATYHVSDENVAVVDESGIITGVSKGECIVSVYCETETLEIPVTVRELTIQDGCTYVDGILIANKSISLPEDYDPGMLPETVKAFKQLQEAAAAEGLNIYEGSGYRSYQYQIKAYNSLVEAYGHEYADRISAKPGHSEHQTGYTVDCNTINDKFIQTPEGKWLDEHCHEFGFIIRYPEGKEDITGYAYECWHIRYVGVEVATEIYEQGLTLEEYLDVVNIENDIPPTEEETAPDEDMPLEDGYAVFDTTVPEENPDDEEVLQTETVISPYQETVPAVAEDDGIAIIDAPLEAP